MYRNPVCRKGYKLRLPVFETRYELISVEDLAHYGVTWKMVCIFPRPGVVKKSVFCAGKAAFLTTQMFALHQAGVRPTT